MRRPVKFCKTSLPPVVSTEYFQGNGEVGSLSGRPPQTHKPTQIHAATFNQPNEKASYICLNPPQALYIYIPFIVPTHRRSPVADVNLPPTFPIPDSLYGYFVVGPGSGLRRLELAWIGYGIYIDIDNIPNCPHDSAFSLCRDVTVGYGRKEKNSNVVHGDSGGGSWAFL